MKRVEASRSILGHCDANKPLVIHAYIKNLRKSFFEII